jgi:Outer membrane protein beta-barrel domain
MKKITRLSILVIAVVLSTTSVAQIRVGITGGVAVTGTSTKDYVRVEKVTSPTFGIIAQANLGLLAFRPSISFLSHGYAYDREAISRAAAGSGLPDTLVRISSDIKTKNIEIPLELVLPLKLKKGRILFSFAPVITIGLKGDSTVSGSRTAGSNATIINRINNAINFGNNPLEIKRANWGSRFGIGYEFRSGLQFNAAYKLGLTNLSNTGLSSKQHYISFTLAWYLIK